MVSASRRRSSCSTIHSWYTGPDPHADEERWHTIGMIGNVVVIVAHTWPTPEAGTGVEVGRIMSARKATAHERRVYEEGDF